MQKLKNIPEEIQLLIVDFLEGNINDQELNKLNQWIFENDQHLNEFNALKSAWLLSEKSIPICVEKSVSALSKMKEIIDQGKIIHIKPFWRFSRIAVSWLIFFLVGISASLIVNKPYQVKREQHTKTNITAPLGSKSLVDLPDGTKVWLNADSRITYNNTYGISDRDVQLTGEAYFIVITNKKIPFIVRTSDVLVKALGTKFNVKAYPNEKTITTTLEEGKIEVTSLSEPSLNKTIFLKPNETATYFKLEKTVGVSLAQELKEEISQRIENKSNIEIIPDVKTELVTSWKDQTWIIESQPLGTLAPILERRYNIEIDFASDEIMKYKFTGKIQRETIEQIMIALELSAPIQYRIEKSRIILSINKKRQKQYIDYTNN